MPVYRSFGVTTLIAYRLKIGEPFFYAEGTEWDQPTVYALDKEQHLISRYNLRLV